jgi:hypothetical protein
MSNIYRTAQGSLVNIDTMRLVNENAIAVGNIPVNARGDEIRPDGTVIKTRNQIMQEHNKNIETVVKYNPRFGPAVELPPAVEESAPMAEETITEEVNTPVESNSNTFRGSLAGAVSINLVDPGIPNTKTLKRI